MYTVSNTGLHCSFVEGQNAGALGAMKHTKRRADGEVDDVGMVQNYWSGQSSFIVS